MLLPIFHSSSEYVFIFYFFKTSFYTQLLACLWFSLRIVLSSLWNKWLYADKWSIPILVWSVLSSSDNINQTKSRYSKRSVFLYLLSTNTRSKTLLLMEPWPYLDNSVKLLWVHSCQFSGFEQICSRLVKWRKQTKMIRIDRSTLISSSKNQEWAFPKRVLAFSV